MLELAGQPALSEFRLEKLANALRKADARVTGVEARYVYFVDLAAPLSAEHELCRANVPETTTPRNPCSLKIIRGAPKRWETCWD